MSVRVVARIRPLLKLELEEDIIVQPACSGVESAGSPTVVRLPNPKNDAEHFSFQFNSVYDQHATQQEIFDHEVAPSVKHLFSGFDVTLFAYGVTGTGKTHTMRGGKSLAERGVIPRMLSSICRRARRVEKDTKGSTQVQVAMSYFEVYNDKIYDLFEPPEKRTAAGLPMRENNGKTVIVGLTERPCTSLKEFEQLYDQANINRSTSATKLNAHSSRSHAILCVKVSQTTNECTVLSTASAIDLAGSEDNRRTENGKERLVESASINRSLFVLAQCVEAISKKQARIPYRESKMTRILSLGQNNGLTMMILNIAPVRSYHLDTLSSLNFANRTKKIEIKGTPNEPTVNNAPKSGTCIAGSAMHRQPLRPLATAHNRLLGEAAAAKSGKPVKAFSVYCDKSRQPKPPVNYQPGKSSPRKRPSESHSLPVPRRAKAMRPSDPPRISNTAGAFLSKSNIEVLIERKVEEKLAARALQDHPVSGPQPISSDVQRRLELLEKRIEGKENGRAEGLQYLLMAKQHQVRGEDASALKMYQLALPFFPQNERLGSKMLALQEKLRLKREKSGQSTATVLPAHVEQTLSGPPSPAATLQTHSRPRTGLPSPEPVSVPENKWSTSRDCDDPKGGNYKDVPKLMDANDKEYIEDGDFCFKPKRPSKSVKPRRLHIFADSSTEPSPSNAEQTPRTKHLLHVINTRDIAQIKMLKGVGAKRAGAIVNCLVPATAEEDEDRDELDDGQGHGRGGMGRWKEVRTLQELGALRGVGVKTVEKMRASVAF